MATLKVSKAEGERLLSKQIEAAEGLIAAAGAFANKQAYDDWCLTHTRWLRFTEEVVRTVFVDHSLADEIESKGPGVYFGGTPWQQDAEFDRGTLRREMNRVVSLRDRLELASEPVDGADANREEETVPSDIFVVHGRNSGVREEVARFVHAITGITPVILHEQANQGRTLIEKFEGHAQQSGYVVVLATGDDKGGPRDAVEADLMPRARQNVVFEMGFFFGSLGRRRVAVLHEEGIEPPSDIAGLVYISLTGNWKLDLLKELRAAGIDADITKAA